MVSALVLVPRFIIIQNQFSYLMRRFTFAICVVVQMHSFLQNESLNVTLQMSIFKQMFSFPLSGTIYIYVGREIVCLLPAIRRSFFYNPPCLRTSDSFYVLLCLRHIVHHVGSHTRGRTFLLVYPMFLYCHCA